MVEGKASTNFIRGILYLLPAIILLGIFTFYPLINTFIISFNEDYNHMTGTYESFGLSNYKLIFNPRNPFIKYLIPLNLFKYSKDFSFDNFIEKSPKK